MLFIVESRAFEISELLHLWAKKPLLDFERKNYEKRNYKWL